MSTIERNDNRKVWHRIFHINQRQEKQIAQSEVDDKNEDRVLRSGDYGDKEDDEDR